MKAIKYNRKLNQKHPKRKRPTIIFYYFKVHINFEIKIKKTCTNERGASYHVD